MTKTTPARTRYTLRSQAWLLRGISSLPGELALRGGLLSFTAQGTGSAWPWQLRRLEEEFGASGIAQRIDQDIPALVFSWPTQEIVAWCPWYYFGGGLKVRRQAVTARFSFGAPANQNLPVQRLDPFAAAQHVQETRDQISNMRSLGAMWTTALDSASTSATSR